MVWRTRIDGSTVIGSVLMRVVMVIMLAVALVGCGTSDDAVTRDGPAVDAALLTAIANANAVATRQVQQTQVAAATATATAVEASPVTAIGLATATAIADDLETDPRLEFMLVGRYRLPAGWSDWPETGALPGCDGDGGQGVVGVVGEAFNQYRTSEPEQFLIERITAVEGTIAPEMFDAALQAFVCDTWAVDRAGSPITWTFIDSAVTSMGGERVARRMTGTSEQVMFDGILLVVQAGFFVVTVVHYGVTSVDNALAEDIMRTILERLQAMYPDGLPPW